MIRFLLVLPDGDCSGGSNGGSFGGDSKCGGCDGDCDCATGTWGDKGVIISRHDTDRLESELSSMNCGDGSAVDTLAGIRNVSWDELIAWDTNTIWLEGEEGSEEI